MPEKNCDFCQKGFNSSEGLRMHMDKCDEGAFKCTLCSLICLGLTGWSSHLKNIHKMPFNVAENHMKTNRTLSKTKLNPAQKSLVASLNERDKSTKSQSAPVAKSPAVNSDKENVDNDGAVSLKKRSKVKAKANQIDTLGSRSFRCRICFKIFTKKGTCMRHIVSFHAKPVPRPKSTTPTKPKLSATTYSVLDDNNYECTQCANVFQTRIEVVRHIREMHLHMKPFQCRLCDLGFGRTERLAIHLKEVHKIRMIKKSKFRHYPQLEEMDDGMFENHPEEELQCGECQDTFESVAAHQSHLDQGCCSKTKTAKDIFGCMLCSSSFKDLESCKRHMDTMHMSKSAVTFKCSKCQDTFADPTSFEIHIRQDCKGNPIYGCGVCDKRFASKLELKAHETMDHNMCGFCTMSFEKESCLDYHIKIVHKKPPPCKCDDCVQEVNVGNTDVEIVTVIDCDMCDSSFHDREDYQKHLQETHVAQTLSCQYCSDTFVDQSALDRHTELEHVDMDMSNVFCCHICNLPFETKELFLSHFSSIHADLVAGPAPDSADTQILPE